MSNNIFSALAVLLLSFMAFGIGNIMISKATAPRTIFLESVEGSVRAKPELVEISIHVKGRSEQSKAASTDKVLQVLGGITMHLKQMGLSEENIVLQGIHTYEDYVDDSTINESGEKSADSRVVFVSAQSLAIRMPIEKSENVSQLIKFLASINAINIESVNVQFENKEKIHQEAGKVALQNAKRQAESIASELGVQLGRVHFVSEKNDLHSIMPSSQNIYHPHADEPNKEFIIPSEQEYKVRLSITYEIR